MTFEHSSIAGDPYRSRTRKVVSGEKRSRGGRAPDQVEELEIGRRTLPKGHEYHRVEDEQGISSTEQLSPMKWQGQYGASVKAEALSICRHTS